MGCTQTQQEKTPKRPSYNTDVPIYINKDIFRSLSPINEAGSRDYTKSLLSIKSNYNNNSSKTPILSQFRLSEDEQVLTPKLDELACNPSQIMKHHNDEKQEYLLDNQSVTIKHQESELDPNVMEIKHNEQEIQKELLKQNNNINSNNNNNNNYNNNNEIILVNQYSNSKSNDTFNDDNTITNVSTNIEYTEVTERHASAASITMTNDDINSFKLERNKSIEIEQERCIDDDRSNTIRDKMDNKMLQQQ